MSGAKQTGREALLWLAASGPIFVACFLLLPYLAGLRAGLLEDDSYFYAQIAYNAPGTGIFTFDGLNPTSGFHPLWALVLCGVSSVLGVFTADKALHLSAYLTVWFLVAGLVTFRVGKSAAQRLVFFALLLLTAPLMETAFLSLILVLLVELSEGARRAEARAGRPHVAILGLSMLVPLARIDASVILLVWMLALRSDRRLLGSVALGLALGVALHFAFLGAVFGEFYSVSSFLKAGSLEQPLRVVRSLSEAGTLARTVVLGLLVVWGVVGLRARQEPHGPSPWLVLGAPIAFTFGHLFISDMRTWYFVPGITFAFWAGARSAEDALQSPSRLWQVGWRAVAALAIVLTLYKSYRFIPLDHVRRASWDFVSRAKSKLPDDARVYQIDGSGFTGYWIGHHLVNGDGLVNSHAYARRMKARKLAGYFQESGICYVITDAQIRAKKPLVSKAGLLLRKREAREVLRSRAYGWSDSPNAHFVLWRILDERCVHPKG